MPRAGIPPGITAGAAPAPVPRPPPATGSLASSSTCPALPRGSPQRCPAGTAAWGPSASCPAGARCSPGTRRSWLPAPRTPLLAGGGGGGVSARAPSLLCSWGHPAAPSCSAGAGARGGGRGPAGACEQGRGGPRASSGSSVCSIWLLPRASETGSPHPSVRPSVPGCVGRLLWGSPCPTSAQLGEGARASPCPHRLGSAAHPSALPSPVHGSCGSGGCWWGWSCRVGCCGGGCSGAGWAVPAPGRLAGARAGVVVLGLAGLLHQGRLCQTWRGCAVPGRLGHVAFGYGRTSAAGLGGAVLHRGRLCWVWPHRAGSAGFGRAMWSWQGRCCRGPGWDCFCNCGLSALWKRHSFPLAGAVWQPRGWAPPCRAQPRGRRRVKGPFLAPPTPHQVLEAEGEERAKVPAVSAAAPGVASPVLTPVPPPAAPSAGEMLARTCRRGGCRGSACL